MNRSNKKPPQTKRHRMAKLLEKGRSEHEPLLSDAEVAKERARTPCSSLNQRAERILELFS